MPHGEQASAGGGFSVQGRRLVLPTTITTPRALAPKLVRSATATFQSRMSVPSEEQPVRSTTGRMSMREQMQSHKRLFCSSGGKKGKADSSGMHAGMSGGSLPINQPKTSTGIFIFEDM